VMLLIAAAVYDNINIFYTNLDVVQFFVSYILLTSISCTFSFWLYLTGDNLQLSATLNSFS
jgi:hypothetical protein